MWSEVPLLKRSVTAQHVQMFTANAFYNSYFVKPTVPLSEVPSANEDNRNHYLEKTSSIDTIRITRRCAMDNFLMEKIGSRFLNSILKNKVGN